MPKKKKKEKKNTFLSQRVNVLELGYEVIIAGKDQMHHAD